MNIFVIDYNPQKSAIYLDDKRVVKMIVESAQILSACLHIWNVNESGIYKLTHKNHPCVKWASYSIKHYSWLFDHFVALCDEYTTRYGKKHKSSNLIPIFYKYKELYDGKSLNYCNCSGDDSSNIISSYKFCLQQKWKHDKRKPSWTNRRQPLKG